MTKEKFISLIKEKSLELKRTVPKDWLNFEINLIKTNPWIIDYFKDLLDKNIQGKPNKCNSSIAYCLGVTDEEPKGLVNVKTGSLPDIDMDFCKERREEIFQYLIEKYGEHKVARIGTYGSMFAKTAIRDIGRVLKIDLKEVDKIAKLIPDGVAGQQLSLEEALKLEPRLNKIKNSKIIQYALKLEGLMRHVGQHAAGVAIADTSLYDYTPIGLIKKEKVTQYDMRALEDLGIVKFDILGLKTLTVINKTKQLIKETQNIELDIDNIPFDDKETYKQLALGNTVGIFQLEGSAITELVKQVVPQNISDIADINALFRPGPIQLGMCDLYVKNKFNGSTINLLHPKLEKILASTHGILIFQEQVMAIARELAGYSLAEADGLRKILGKKLVNKVESERVKFVDGCIKNNIDKNIANKIFDQMAAFAEYGFNKSHAVAYSFITYQTAYLKTHFLKEYMTALMSSVFNDSVKLMIYCCDAQKNGLKLYPPSINHSTSSFKIESDGIRFGLASIKGLSKKSAKEIIKARPFKNLIDFVKRINTTIVDTSVTKSLILAGAFDEIESDRSKLFANVDHLYTIKKKNRDKMIRIMARVNKEAASQRFGSMEEEEIFKHDLINKLKQERLLDYYMIEPETRYNEIELTFMERQTYGFYPYKHAVSFYTGGLRCEDVNKLRNFQKVDIIGSLENVETIKTRSGKIIMKFFISGESSFLEASAYNINPNQFEEGKIYIFRGTLNKLKSEPRLNVKAILEPKLNVKKIQKEKVKCINLQPGFNFINSRPDFDFMGTYTNKEIIINLNNKEYIFRKLI